MASRQHARQFEEGTVLGAGLQDRLCPQGLQPVQAGRDIVSGTRNPELVRGVTITGSSW